MFDYTIPIWGVIVFVVIPVALILLKMFITQGVHNDKIKLQDKQMILMEKTYKERIDAIENSNKLSIDEIKKDLHSQEKTLSNLKKDIEEKLDKHKIATDSKLSSINDSVIETKTLVKLLVENRIKPDRDKG